MLAVHGTYDTARASWYEAMAIMPVAATRRPAGGADPFRTNVAVPGVLTHGHLPENDHHGGVPGGPYASPAALPDGPRTNQVQVSGFLYGQGDLSLPDARRDPPVVAPGQSVQFVNRDARARRLPHHHRLPAAVHRDDRDRVPARERRRSSTPASSASARRCSPPPPTATRGRRPRRSRRARTPTSAASTRSCAARSGSRADRGARASSSRRPTRPRGCSRSGRASAATR